MRALAGARLLTVSVCAMRLQHPSLSFSDISIEALRVEQRAFVEERDWEQYHTPRSLALALVGEVGEVCELFQWRGDEGAEPSLPSWSVEESERLGEELADVLSYVMRIADVCEVDLPAAFLAKMKKNRAKYPADLARGSAAKYTAYAAPTSAAPEQPPGAPPTLAVAGQPAGEGDEGALKREWGPPMWVTKAYARAAARVEAQYPSSESTSRPVPREALNMEPKPAFSLEPRLTVQQRAKLRAEAKLAALRAGDVDGDSSARAPPVVAADNTTDTEFESMDDLWGFMEFDDGSV
mmetsp:Transcript_2312/g.4794  ORF Transcript_2312/g.4794 Transcript_2312/m.4794 type:complete len:295 (-) Transcript_2312:322-1206(-)